MSSHSTVSWWKIFCISLKSFHVLYGGIVTILIITHLNIEYLVTIDNRLGCWPRGWSEGSCSSWGSSPLLRWYEHGLVTGAGMRKSGGHGQYQVGGDNVQWIIIVNTLTTDLCVEGCVMLSWRFNCFVYCLWLPATITHEAMRITVGVLQHRGWYDELSDQYLTRGGLTRLSFSWYTSFLICNWEPLSFIFYSIF